VQVYREEDTDPALIRGRRVAIVGYGNQGRAQALNLRDSGVSELRIALD
jgi:ketol-acid reductoisomerase